MISEHFFRQGQWPQLVHTRPATLKIRSNVSNHYYYRVLARILGISVLARSGRAGWSLRLFQAPLEQTLVNSWNIDQRGGVE